MAKAPYVDPKLLQKVIMQKQTNTFTPIKTWSRRTTIIPEFVGHSFLVHNGKTFILVKVIEEMVGHKLGEFAPTRIFRGHPGHRIREEREKARQLERKK